MAAKVKHEEVSRYADMFAAMGSEPRLRIMRLLLSAHPDGMVVGEIGTELEITASTLSHHLEKLKNEDLVRVRREGTFLRYLANTAALQELLGFLYAECCTRNKAVEPRKDRLLQIGEDMSDIKEVVKEKYGQAALRVVSGQGNACCGSSPSSCCSGGDPITSDLYNQLQKDELPEAAVLASLGCGNPTALAELEARRSGSGPGKRRRHRRAALGQARLARRKGLRSRYDRRDAGAGPREPAEGGVQNVEFLKGEIENIPLPDNSVDVIISNCVINLSADKDRVLREAFRVLKPGGRFAVSDVVTRGEIPAEIRKNMLLWVGCVAGALEENEYRPSSPRPDSRRSAIEPTRIYRAEDALSFLADKGIDVEKIGPLVDGKFMSAFVRAQKPQRQ